MINVFFFYPLLLFHLILGISAFCGGGMLILRPDGSLLGMQAGWLRHSPFTDYLIPGLILFLFNGLLPLFTCIGLLLKPQWNWANSINIYRNRHWAWTYSLYIGIISISWIIVQQIMTRYFWIQPIILSIGLFIIIFTMMPSIMKKFEAP